MKSNKGKNLLQVFKNHSVRKSILWVVILSIFLTAVLLSCTSLGFHPANLPETPGPSPLADSQNQSALAAIKDRGSIIIGTSITKPFEYYDPTTNALIGFDVDLANAIAADMGVEIQWVEMPFANLLPALENKKVDMTIAAMYITAEREQVVDFSQPYLHTGLVMVTNAENVNQFHSIYDLSGKKVGVKIGATGDELANQLIEQGISLQVVGYKETLDSLLDLEVNRVDVVFNDYLNTKMYINDFQSDLQMIVDSNNELIFLSTAGLGIAVHQSDPQLLEEINKILLQMKDEKKIQALYKAWFKANTIP